MIKNCGVFFFCDVNYLTQTSSGCEIQPPKAATPFLRNCTTLDRSVCLAMMICLHLC